MTGSYSISKWQVIGGTYKLPKVLFNGNCILRGRFKGALLSPKPRINLRSLALIYYLPDHAAYRMLWSVGYRGLFFGSCLESKNVKMIILSFFIL